MNISDDMKRSMTDLDLIGVTNPRMSNRERFEASSAYWADRYRMIRAGKAPRGNVPQPAGLCPMCNDAGWYMRGRELTKCQCGYAGPSPAQKRLNSELENLSHKTFDNFDLHRPYTATTDAPEAFQKQMVRVAYQKAKSWAQDPSGWLYIHGTPGCGKSHMAAGIANMLSADGRVVIYRSMPAMIDYMRDSMKSGSLESVYQTLGDADIVIYDDIGAEAKSEWVDGVLFRLINCRVDKATVFTSNLDVPDLRYNARIIDRLNNSKRAWIATTSYREILASKL